MDKVESGKILDMFKGLFNKIDKYLKKLDMETHKQEKTPDGGVRTYYLTKSRKNEICVVYYFKNAGKRGSDEDAFSGEDSFDDTVNVIIAPCKNPGGAVDKSRAEKFANISLKDELPLLIVSKIQEWFGEMGPSEDEDASQTYDHKTGQKIDREDSSLRSSRRMKVGLRKVVSDTETSVELSSITSNYSALATMEDLNSLVNDDTFLDDLPESYTTYTVSYADDGTDDLLCEECSDDGSCMMNTMCSLIIGYERARIVSKYVCWNASGPYMAPLKEKCRDISWAIESHLDMIASMSMSTIGYVPMCEPTQISLPDPMLSDSLLVDIVSGCRILQDEIEELIAMIDMLSCNVYDEYKSMFDEWIRTWRSIKSDIINMSNVE